MRERSSIRGIKKLKKERLKLAKKEKKAFEARQKEKLLYEKKGKQRKKDDKKKLEGETSDTRAGGAAPGGTGGKMRRQAKDKVFA